ncbi:methyltransferase domain-containing protein [bacterium]|nr:methyltransferase domain-containing protein [bacterium]
MPVQDEFDKYQSDQREMFDQLITRDWETYASPQWDATRRFEIRRLFAATRPRVIADIGCGCGFHAAEMARAPFVEHIHAIDYSTQSIARAKQHFAHPKVDHQVAELGNWQPPEPADLVTSFQVIEHVENAEWFLRQCATLCKPRGRIAVFTVHLMRPYNRKRLRYGKTIELEDPMHRREFTPASLLELGLRAGLRPVRIFTYAADAPRLPHRLALWLGYLIPVTATRLAAIFEKGSA